MSNEIRFAKYELGRMIAVKVRQNVKLLSNRTGYPCNEIFRLCNGHGRFRRKMVLAVAKAADVPTGIVNHHLSVIHAPAAPCPYRFRGKATKKRSPRRSFR